MTSTFLSQEEVRELTGRAVKSKQIDWLRTSGIRFYVNAAGFPVIPRSEIDNPREKLEIISKPWESSVERF